MTDQDLRDLLQERVSDLSTTDLSAAAWREARRRRARRRTTVVAGVAVGAIAVVGAVAVAERDDPGAPAGPVSPSPSPSPAGDGPDAVVGAASVYWSPTPAEEDELEPPAQDGVLPATIDLAADAPAVESHPVSRAVAAFAISRDDRVGPVVLVTPDGYRTLTLPGGLEPRADMLSADGTSVQLPTATYSFATGEWTEHPAASSVVPEVPPQVAATTSYGAPRWEPMTGLAYDFGADVPVPEGSAAGPESVVVTPRLGPPTILAIDRPAVGSRWKRCCPVAGWLEPGTVVYESRGPVTRLIAWRVGTHDFSVVSRIVGLEQAEWYVASFAALDADAETSSTPEVTWAPDAEELRDLDRVDPSTIGERVESTPDHGDPPDTGIPGGTPAGRGVLTTDGLVAQAWGRNPALAVPDLDTYVDGPTYVSVTGDGSVRLLAFATRVGDEVPAPPRVAGVTAGGDVVLDYAGVPLVWDVDTRTLRRLTSR
jgi:hypothetical protein